MRKMTATRHQERKAYPIRTWYRLFCLFLRCSPIITLWSRAYRRIRNMNGHEMTAALSPAHPRNLYHIFPALRSTLSVSILTFTDNYQQSFTFCVHSNRNWRKKKKTEKCSNRWELSQNQNEHHERNAQWKQSPIVACVLCRTIIFVTSGVARGAKQPKHTHTQWSHIAWSESTRSICGCARAEIHRLWRHDMKKKKKEITRRPIISSQEPCSHRKLRRTEKKKHYRRHEKYQLAGVSLHHSRIPFYNLNHRLENKTHFVCNTHTQCVLFRLLL